jgi:hypothetical protein
MDWGTFWTWIAQIAIVLVIVFVIAAAVAGIRESQKKDKGNG